MEKKYKFLVVIMVSVLVIGYMWFTKVRVSEFEVKPMTFHQIDKTSDYCSEEVGTNLGLINPAGLAVDSSNRLYIADSGNNRIAVLDDAGKLIKTIGTSGNGHGSFLKPLGLAIREDKLYVADSENYKIQILTLDGDFIEETDLNKLRVKPLDITVSDKGIYFTVTGSPQDQKLYVIDNKNKVQKIGKLLLGSVGLSEQDKVLFTNEVIIKKTSDGWHGMSGENSVYEVVDGKLNEVFALPYKYAPQDVVWDSQTNSYYIICGAFKSIGRFSATGEYLGTIFNSDFENDYLTYMTIDRKGIIYCSSPLSNKLYRVRSNTSE